MARYFTVSVRMENDAMQSLADVAPALVESLNTYGRKKRGTIAPVEVGDSGNIYDLNGNLVGDWIVQELVS